MAASHMHMRFRKQFPILGHFLKWTISKRGISINAHAGIFSRSWGTRGNTETIDAPGHFGLYWRKQSRRHGAQSGAKVEGWHLAAIVIVVEGLIEASYIWAHPLISTCVT